MSIGSEFGKTVGTLAKYHPAVRKKYTFESDGKGPSFEFSITPANIRWGEDLEISAKVKRGEYSRAALEAELSETFGGMDIEYSEAGGKETFLVKGPAKSFWNEPTVARVVVSENGIDFSAYGTFFVEDLQVAPGGKENADKLRNDHRGQVAENFVSVANAIGRAAGASSPLYKTRGTITMQEALPVLGRNPASENHSCYDFSEVSKYCSSFVPSK